MHATHTNGEGARAMGDLVAEVYRLYYRLRQVEAELHGGGDTTEAQRGVLFDLFAAGQATVPALARDRGLSRQRLQQIMNALLERGLTRALPNPAHETSPLYDMTPAGRRAVLVMLRREQRYMKGISSTPGARQIRTTVRVLRALRESLASLRSKKS